MITRGSLRIARGHKANNLLFHIHDRQTEPIILDVFLWGPSPLRRYLLRKYAPTPDTAYLFILPSSQPAFLAIIIPPAKLSSAI